MPDNFNNLGFQEPATPVMEGIIDLHNYIFFYLVLILGFVLFVFIDIFVQHIEVFRRFKYISYNFSPLLRKTFFHLNRINHATKLEVIWTTIPSFILILIAIPSLALLYSMDELLYPQMTFKATGYQWYWTYEYSDRFIEEDALNLIWEVVAGMWLMDIDHEESPLAAKELCFRRTKARLPYYMRNKEATHWFFESYMVPTEELDPEENHRLLSTTQEIVLPTETHIRLLVTGADVLHSWAVPSLGIKIDAVPGRLNQVAIYLKREGVFYGQCSELCGANHAFMPITVQAAEMDEFYDWYAAYLQQRFAILYFTPY